MKQNIQSQLTILRHLNLKLEDAPAFGGGSMPAKDESLFCRAGSLFPSNHMALETQGEPSRRCSRQRSPEFRHHRHAHPLADRYSRIAPWRHRCQNRNIGVSVLSLGLLLLVVYAMMQSRQGKLLRYPINFRLIK